MIIKPVVPEQSPDLSPVLSSTVPQTVITALDVEGMRCAGCVQVVERRLTQQPGVVAASVNLVTKVAVVEYERAIASPDALAGSLTQAGFPSQPRNPDIDPSADLAKREAAERQELIAQVWRVAIAGILLCLSGLGHIGDLFGLNVPGLSNIWFHAGLATVAMVGPGRFMLVDGWRGLKNNAPTMNTLIGLGIFTAYTASLVALLFPQLGWECFFDEPVMLIGFILLGQTLEHRARNRASAALRALVTLQPTIARLVPTQTLGTGNAAIDADTPIATPVQGIEIPAERVRVGEWLQVLPGEKIPVDGEILAGQTTVDESLVTGEAVPVLKQAGDAVIAGTLNQSGLITIRATRIGKNTTLSQIIALVEAAQTRKAPIQRLADQVAGKFAYLVMAIATVTFLFWYGIGTHLWPHILHHLTPSLHHLTAHSHASTPLPSHYSPLLLSLKLAIAVLVVACPCALGLATPTAILVGSGIGAERGLLIRGGDVLESVHTLNTIVFDKTGTLTVPTPQLTDCISLTSDPRPPLLQLAATVESGTCHPLATAIQQQAIADGIDLLPARDFYTAPGLGVSAIVSGFAGAGVEAATGEQRVLLGTADWLQEQGITVTAAAIAQANTLADGGKTVIFAAVGTQVIGLLGVTNPLRGDAQAAVAALQALGLQVVIMTGDQATAATAIAHQLGLPDSAVIAGVRPDGKADAIAQLQASGQRVAMVGDGINDAPALAQADVGIALHSGTDVAVETANIVLMGDRLQDVVEAIRLSRATFNKIRQNLIWAMGYNLVGIPLAAGALLPAFGVLLSPATAGAMMALSSISVVTNSLSLRLAFSTKSVSDK